MQISEDKIQSIYITIQKVLKSAEDKSEESGYYMLLAGLEGAEAALEDALGDAPFHPVATAS